MKILYIGDADPLACAVINQMSKESDEMFLLAPNDFDNENRPKHLYKYYESSNRFGTLDSVFRAVFPEVIIWAGCGFMKAVLSEDDCYTYLSELNYWLDRCTLEGNKRLLLLSSTEVYGYHAEVISEDTICSPHTKRGMLMAQAEAMVELYHNQRDLTRSVLRCGMVYDYQYHQNKSYLMEQLVEDVTDRSKNSELLKEDYSLQPVNVRDTADAMKRTIYASQHGTFNVCATTSVMMSTLYELTAKKLNRDVNFTEVEPGVPNVISNEKIKSELEWVEFKHLDQQLASEPLEVNKRTKIYSDEKKQHRKTTVRRSVMFVIENIALFLMFTGLQYVFRDNALFGGIDWMILYIVSIGLFFGVSQSFLAVLLASVIFFLQQDITLLEITNFYSYAGGVIQIAQYIFLGIVTAYVTDFHKEEIRSQSVNCELLEEEKTELSIICNENILIKNEYEKRLLSAKNSLPTLYAIIGKISVLEPERIFMEILTVIAEQLETDTVSLYLAKQNSPYLRLVTSRNEKSVYKGKSWNLNDTPSIKKAIEQDLIFQGNHWEEEPALVSPIYAGGMCLAIIVVKDIPFEKQTLYQVNLLRTLTVLISESVSKAIDYETITHANRYLMGTDILIYDEFVKLLAVEKVKRQKEIAESCLLRCNNTVTPEALFELIAPLLRNTDSLGMDKYGNVIILLGNTSQDDAAAVVERLNQRGISPDFVSIETLLED